MDVIGNLEVTIAAVKDNILDGASQIDIELRRNGIYVGQFKFDTAMDDPTQKAADEAIVKAVGLLQAAHEKLLVVRRDATTYEIS